MAAKADNPAEPTPAEFVVVLVTVPDAETATQLAQTLLEERRVACVNRIRGVASLFRWEGRVEEAQEELLILKARRTAFPALSARVVELHPYEVPEVLALPVVAGSEPYLRWLAAESDS